MTAQERRGMPLVAIDSREWARPYKFPRQEVRTLSTGDYSLFGMEDRVTVERKTKSDLYACMGRRKRRRFKREMERMAEYEYAALVVEASLEDLLHPPPFSLMPPRVVVNTLLAWSIRYGVHVFFAGSRKNGQALTRRILEKFCRYTMETIDDE